MNDSPFAALYNTTRWRKLRKEWIEQHPLCADHMTRGRVVAGQVVDHVKPHKGSLDLFWSRSNLQTLCKPCHDGHKQRMERSTVTAGCDLDGTPTDPRHPWSSHGRGA